MFVDQNMPLQPTNNNSNTSYSIGPDVQLDKKRIIPAAPGVRNLIN